MSEEQSGSTGGEEKLEKPSHPPAIKVGGMRVAGRRKHKSSEGADDSAGADDAGDAAKEPSEDQKGTEEDYGSEVVKDSRSRAAMVSGALVKESEAFPEAAMQNMQQKPHYNRPTHEKRPMQQHHAIHQPTKQ